MFKIGDFSRIARVSGRLLRYYDSFGLLSPMHTDPATCYRHYSADQLGRLNRILALKELGLSLERSRGCSTATSRVTKFAACSC
jgi:DNA-binding transcriptional MerR regulator